MHQSPAKSTSSVLEYATQEIISKASSLVNANLSAIGPTNIDYFFVYFNALNDYAAVFLDGYRETAASQQGYADLFQDQGLIILVISACIMLLASLLLTLFLNRTINTRQEILKIFLDIPEKTAKLFYTKCENFL